MTRHRWDPSKLWISSQQGWSLLQSLCCKWSFPLTFIHNLVVEFFVESICVFEVCMPYRKYPVQKVYRTCVRVHALKQFFGPLGNRTDSLTRAGLKLAHTPNVIETKHESRRADRARLNSAGQPILQRQCMCNISILHRYFSVLQVYTLQRLCFSLVRHISQPSNCLKFKPKHMQ